jgi:6,7-dimethyl-8-ribityllumazine synthase
LEGAKAVCFENGLPENQVFVFECPGAFELPLTAAWCFSQGFDAVVCLGTIIRGDTPHFDYVSAAAADGILRAGLDAQKPCVFGVLTVNNAEQVEERIGGIHGHKGREAAETALQMLVLKSEISGKI